MSLFGPPDIPKLRDRGDVARLIKALRYKERDIRGGAAEALGTLGDSRAVELLIAALGDEDDWVRDRVKRALGHLHDARAVEPLIAALKDGEYNVAEPLGNLGDARAVAPLIAALGAVGPESRHSYYFQDVTSALVKLGDAAVEPLIAALADPDPQARLGAIRALQNMRDGRAVEPLVAMLGDEKYSVRAGAAQALALLGWAPQTDAQRAQFAVAQLGDSLMGAETKRAKFDQVKALGSAAVEPLIAALAADEPSARASAADLLGELGDDRAVEPLVAVSLRDRAEYVRLRAAGALVTLGEPRAVEPLSAALGAESRDLRSEAAQALGKLGDSHAVERLIGALGDEDESVRRHAAEALGKLGDPRAVEPLIAAVKRGESYAAYALGELGDDRAVEPLVSALDGPRTVADAAERALIGLGESAAQPVTRMLDHPVTVVRARATEALWKIGDPRSLESLLSVLHDPDEGVRRLAALGVMEVARDSRAIQPLVRAFRDEDVASVRETLQAALSVLTREHVPGAEQAVEGLEERQQ